MQIENVIIQIVSEVLHDWGKKHAELLRENLKEVNKINRGDLYDSIQFDVSGMTLTISMLEYAYYVDQGRKPGSFPPVDKIRGWVEDKGLSIDGSNQSLEKQQRSLTYLIGRKIEREGIEPAPFIDELPVDEIAEDIVERLEEKFVELIIGQN